MGEEIKEDEQYSITKDLAKVKIGDLGQIWTYPALHIFHGTMPDKIVKDVTEYCAKTNNDKASKYLIANLEGTQSELDPDDPLMKEFIERMMRSVCTYIDECEINYGLAQTPKTVDIKEIWDVKMLPGDYNPLHVHGTDSKEGLSSIFYLKVPKSIKKAWEEGSNNPKYDYSSKKDGMLKFIWGLSTYQNSDSFACGTSTFILPEVGHFYIFPKSLNHEVMPFRDEEDRWSVQVNFNCWAKGEKEANKAQEEAGGVSGADTVPLLNSIPDGSQVPMTPNQGINLAGQNLEFAKEAAESANPINLTNPNAPI